MKQYKWLEFVKKKKKKKKSTKTKAGFISDIISQATTICATAMFPSPSILFTRSETTPVSGSLVLAMVCDSRSVITELLRDMMSSKGRMLSPASGRKMVFGSVLYSYP
jgi:hypothetical protein